MTKEMPFDEDVMTLIMGVSPEEPGQHGRTKVPMPKEDAVGLICSIKEMCEQFLEAHGESCGEALEDKEDNSNTERQPDDKKGKPFGKKGKPFGKPGDDEDDEEE